ncbi:MAG: EAL domain-containing protein [Treponemataceae bacterium]
MDFLCSATQLNVYNSAQYITFRAIITGLYFIVRNFTVLFLDFYILVITNMTYKLKQNKIFSILLPLPFLVLVVLIISNAFTRFMFYFDQDLNYNRGPFILVSYSVAAIYSLIGFIILLRYRKVFKLSKLCAFYGFFILSIAAVVVQLFLPNWLVEIFFTSLSLTLVMGIIQRPEEYIYTVLGVFNYSGFKTNIQNFFINNTPTNIVLVKILNCEFVRSTVGQENFTNIQRRIVHDIDTLLKKSKLRGDIYYLSEDRFAVVFNDTSQAKYMEFANQILEYLNNIQGYSGQLNGIKTSVCYVELEKNSEIDKISNLSSLLILAENFHKMPHTGKIITLKDKQTKSYFEQFIAIDFIINDALEHKKFEMYYQPIYSVEQDKILSAEALIRLKDKQRSYISPEIFIPASERNGTILQIGEFVLDSVCKFIASDQFKKLGLEHIAVNLSVNQCMQPDLAETIDFYTKKYKVEPKHLNFEITEGSVDESESTMLKNMQILSEKGYSFNLDDYGTGYSNIKRLATLPLKIIKFDKTFVNEIGNHQMKIILKNNIRMMKEMNKEIVVEGIETKEMLEIFCDYNCDFIQGFYFSRPLPGDEFCKWVDRWKKEKNPPGNSILSGKAVSIL